MRYLPIVPTDPELNGNANAIQVNTLQSHHVTYAHIKHESWLFSSSISRLYIMVSTDAKKTS